MSKNGAWDASTCCSSYVPMEGLVKHGLLLIKIVYWWGRGDVGVEAGRRLQEHMLDSFHSPEVTMIDGI